MNKPPIEGYSPQRWLEDGRFVGVCPLSFGRARICIGDELSVTDNW